jgi:hypothetical protein
MTDNQVDVYDDVIFAFDRFQTSTIEGDARKWLFGLGPLWADSLRGYLALSWPDDEVDAYMVRYEQREAERARQLAWEATWRGKTAMAWRALKRETSERVPGAWKVLRHGVDDHADCSW